MAITKETASFIPNQYSTSTNTLMEKSYVARLKVKCQKYIRLLLITLSKKLKLGHNNIRKRSKIKLNFL